MKKIVLIIVSGLLAIGAAQGSAILNPDISVILDTFYYVREGALEESEPERQKGFNLESAEVFLTAPVDPYFRLTATIPVKEEGAELEEAFVTSVSGGLNWKLGKFRSAFGRLNRQHPHFRDFADSPLIFRKLVGEEGLVEKGLQVTFPFGGKDYWALGAEILQGENFEAFGDLKKKGPHMYHLFVEQSREVGKDLTYLVTVSYLEADFGRMEETEPFWGKVKPMVAATLTLKSIPGGRAIYRGWILQSEWFERRVEGSLAGGSVRREDRGGYVQFVYRFDRRWRAGARYDFTHLDPAVEGTSPHGHAMMVDYSPSEFSRIRGQWNRTRIGGRHANEYFLQFQFGVGPHAPHPF